MVAARRLAFAFGKGLTPRDQAALLIVRAEDKSVASTLAVEDWLSANPRNIEAYAESAWIWRELDKLAPADEPVVPQAYQLNRRYLIGGAIAAGVAAVVMPGLLADSSSSYRTKVGEQRVVELADGSRLTLNTDTRISVRYEKDARRLMLERGEALFEVAHDTARPFVVTSGNQSVRALGTSFVVRRHPGWVEVTLLSGRVEVTGADGKLQSVTSLVPGQRVSAGADGSPRLDAPRLDAVIAWCDGQLLLDETPLAKAIAEMNRYQVKPIVLQGASADARLSGVFRTGESRIFASTVAAMYGLRVSETPQAILVSAG